jgi:4-amino-4-deoxy-L-arabinose transferase-like glycosyltransferase
MNAAPTAPTTPRDELRRLDARVIAAAAAVVLTIEQVGRAAVRPVGWQHLAAQSSMASVALYAIVLTLAVRWWLTQPPAPARWFTATGWVVAVVGLRVCWSLITGTHIIDPVGHGEVLPAGTPILLSITILLAVTAAAFWLAPRERTPVSGWIVLVAIVAASVLMRWIDDLAVAGISSALVAILVTAWAVGGDTASTGEAISLPAHGTMLAGIAVAAPSARFVLDKYVERVHDVDGAAVMLGAVFPPALWSATLVVAVGILVGAARVAPAFGRRLVDRPALYLPAILAVAHLFRVWALYAISTARRDNGDPLFYHLTANLLANGRGFEEPLIWVNSGMESPSALHGPGFPAVLSLVSRFGGVSYVDHQWASILMGLPQIAFAVLLAHRLAGRRAALLTGAICIVYPNLWLTDGSLFVEGLMAGLTTAATWAMYRWLDHPRPTTIAVIGVLIGAAALTRGEALLLIPLFFGGVVLLRRSVEWRRRLAHAAIGTVAAVATLAPWMIYNAPRFNVFVPLSTNSNEVLFYANCDDVYFGPFLGFWSFDCQTRHREEFGDAPGDQAEQAVFWRKLAIEYVRDHIDRVPVVVAARVGRQWELFRPGQTVDFAFIEGRDRRSVQIGQLGFYLMMPLTIAGSLALRRRRHPLLPMWSHAIAVTATAVYAYGTLRFRAPWEPIMVTLAAIGLVFLWDQRDRILRRRSLSPHRVTSTIDSTTMRADILDRP